MLFELSQGIFPILNIPKGHVVLNDLIPSIVFIEDQLLVNIINLVLNLLDFLVILIRILLAFLQLQLFQLDLQVENLLRQRNGLTVVPHRSHLHHRTELTHELLHLRRRSVRRKVSQLQHEVTLQLHLTSDLLNNHLSLVQPVEVKNRKS